jgi:predicted nucleic acid-binding protein
VTCVVDCSIIVRLLASLPGDAQLRQRLSQTVHAPALIDAAVSSVIRNFTITTKPNVRLSEARALEMLDDYAGLRIVRHAMQPLQGRVFEMRHNFTAYDAMHVALAERLGLPLLTDDRKFDSAPGHHAEIQRHPAEGPTAGRYSTSGERI